MRPDPPKKGEELVEHVEMWQDKMRRLEARGGIHIGTSLKDQHGVLQVWLALVLFPRLPLLAEG